MARWRSALAAMAISAMLAPGSGFAKGQAQVRLASSNLVFFRLAVDTPGRLREQALIDALGLVLDDFGILSVSPAPGFDRLPLREQIATVKSLAEQEDCAAAVWLAASSEPIMLHLVALQAEKTLVRSFEASKQARLETSMAIAVRELLGAAYLFERDLEPSPAVQTLVNTMLQEQIERRVPRGAPQLEFGVRATGLFHEGIWGQTGVVRRFGARLVGEVIIGPRLHLGLSGEFTQWPEYSAGGLGLSSWSVAPGIEWSTHWSLGKVGGPLSLGSVVAAQAVWEHFESGGDTREVLSTWRGQVQGGVDLRWLLWDGFGCYFSPRLEANFSRVTIVHRADGARLAATPWIGFKLEFGVIFETGNRRAGRQLQ